jgi:hypothetical protein
MRQILFYSLVMLVLFGLTNCRDRRQSVLPLVSFSIFLNVNEPSLFDLSVPSGWVYYSGNTVDLIIYRNSTDEFTCLDARSTYNVEDDCMVRVMDDNVVIEDPCSGSQWLIMDGSVINGPASAPLVSYDYTFDSATGELHIFN